jgi:hypothetical protein
MLLKKGTLKIRIYMDVVGLDLNANMIPKLQ